MRLLALIWISAAVFAGAADPVEVATELVRAGRLQEAESTLRAALAEHAESERLHGELGRVLLAAGKYESAVQELGRAANAFPESPGYNMGLAEALLGWRRFSVATQFLEAVQSRFGDLPDYHYNLGIAYYSLSNLRKALPAFEEAARRDPELDRARFFIASCRAALNDLPGAAAGFRSLVREKPRNAAYWLALGKVLDQLGEEYRSEALVACRRALDLKPGDLGAQFQIGLILAKLDDFEGAKPLLEAVVRAQPDELAGHVALARVYYRLKELDLAEREKGIIRKLQEAQKTAPPSASDSR